MAADSLTVTASFNYQVADFSVHVRARTADSTQSPAITSWLLDTVSVGTAWIDAAFTASQSAFDVHLRQRTAAGGGMAAGPWGTVTTTEIAQGETSREFTVSGLAANTTYDVELSTSSAFEPEFTFKVQATTEDFPDCSIGSVSGNRVQITAALNDNLVGCTVYFRYRLSSVSAWTQIPSVTAPAGQSTAVSAISPAISAAGNYVVEASLASDFSTVFAKTISVVFDIDLDSANADPRGVCSDGTTIWVADYTDEVLYAYSADGTRDSSKDIDLHADNQHPQGLWSDDTTIWVLDTADDKLYAYAASDGSRDTSSEFDLDSGNDRPSGIWSDGTTMYVTDTLDDKLYAYTLSDGSRDSSSDVDLGLIENQKQTTDTAFIWGDGTTLWMTKPAVWIIPPQVLAFALSDGSYDSSSDLELASANFEPRGLWGAAGVIWVADSSDLKLYAYDLSSGQYIGG